MSTFPTMREQAVSMGAQEPPMPKLVEICDRIVATFIHEKELYGATDSPPTVLVAASTISQCGEVASFLNRNRLRTIIVTSGSRNLSDVLRAVSAGEVDAVAMPMQLATAGGFRWPAGRVLMACTQLLSEERAVQFLARAHREAARTSMVWLRPPAPEYVPAPAPKMYSNLLVTFDMEKLTPIQQDSIVSVLIGLGCVEKVELGSMETTFNTSETITRDDAEKVHRALNQPDED